MKNTRLKSQPLLTRAAVEVLVSNIRSLKISERKIQADRDAAVQNVDAGCAPHLARIAAELERDVELCRAWAEANPEEFGKLKSITLAHGTLGFRTGTPKLVMTKRAGGWKGALDRVMMYLPAFIREVPEIDKEALIAQRDDGGVRDGLKLAGLAVTQEESFYVEPTLTEVETREVREAV